MKDSIQFLRKLNKLFPDIDITLEFRADFYNFLGGKLDYEYVFTFKNLLDHDYIRLKSKNLHEPFYQKCLKNLTKYKKIYEEEMERQKKPKKFTAED